MVSANNSACFSPVSPYDFEKKLSAKECENRQKRTTALQLEKLLRSEEFCLWKAKSLKPSPVPLAKTLGISLCLCTLAILVALSAITVQVGLNTFEDLAIENPDVLVHYTCLAL